uniref:E3 ubiquitin-protein ligase RNF180-like isoform X2 n=1 Tax=Monopterus albus TaxID=43700 RepID=UPI0009B4D6C1|nr:E3 ubiquitin-protein ligase RNF180-like isoform X2 [Monopterus albus]
MLRCRRCRKGVIDSACVAMVEDTMENPATVCSIWHVNIDTMPEWMLTSVHQAQWTVGKLNCQNCGARLGGFNFINRSECPCGLDATVHLSKSRVERDIKHYVLIVQPKRSRPEKDQADLLIQRPHNSEERSEINRTALDSLQLNCATVNPAQSKSLMDKSVVDLSRTRGDEPTQSPVSFPTSQHFETEADASPTAAPCLRVSESGRTALDQQLLQTVEDAQFSAESTAADEERFDSAPFLRRRHVSDSAAEQEEEVVPQASQASNRLSKREKNHLKSLRRKQRRRERWLHSQLEQVGSVSSSQLDSEEEDREGITCAVCLDVYFSPLSCQPCGHIFCEPCLRTLAKNRPTHTPCPLCRALISHTSSHKELDQTAKTLFPKVYYTRKQNFQNAPCAKWPLPSFHKHFHAFWGLQRRPAMRRRHWHLAHGGLMLDAMDFNDTRGWLFDIGLVIIYVHSVSWILAFLCLCFIMYYFFF